MNREQLSYLLRLVKGGMLERATTIIEQELAKPEQDHGFDRTASHMAGEYVDTAKLEQEPVAWVSESESTKQFVEGRPRRVWWECNTGVGKPFYIAPPRKEWVGLTGIEVRMLKDIHIPIYSIPILDDYLKLYRAIENQLKEKNA